MKYIIIAISLALFTGCVNVEHAEITDSTFNTSGWKSAAGQGNAIEATTTPTTTTGL